MAIQDGKVVAHAKTYKELGEILRERVIDGAFISIVSEKAWRPYK